MNLHASKKGSALGTTIGVVVAILIVVAIVYALTKKSTTSTPTSTPTPTASVSPGSSAATGTTVQATIANTAFTQPSLTVHVGDTVTWTNQDSMSHTVNSTDGGALNSGNIAPGGTYSFTFTKAGTYAYKCNYHSFMTGTVTVQ